MIEVSPGAIRLTRPDLNRREKTLEKERLRRLKRVNEEAAALQLEYDLAQANEDWIVAEDSTPLLKSKPVHRPASKPGAVTCWSKRSRARMILRLSELDYRPMFAGQLALPAMVTLTYPGDWQAVAPNFYVVKDHLKRFFQRFKKAWDTDFVGLWKLEFQGRGAPHFHLFMVPPTGVASAARRARHEMQLAQWEVNGRQGRKPGFRRAVGDGLGFQSWLSQVWADIVGSQGSERTKHEAKGVHVPEPIVDLGEGMRAADPRRLAVYFSKHGTFKAKDYQNVIPELWQQSGGAGHFWGIRGLKPLRSHAVVDFDDYYLVARTLRKLMARRRYWDPVNRRHLYQKAPVNSFRYRGSGFITTNSGPKLAADLYRLIQICGSGSVVEQRWITPTERIRELRCNQERRKEMNRQMNEEMD
ncbi:hypothetical protein ACN95_03245 [Gordonia sihwensis]|nr:hypothetical protein [Gordonia sihwensis]